MGENFSIDVEKLQSAASELDSLITNFNENINTYTANAQVAQEAFSEAKSYDGQKLEPNTTEAVPTMSSGEEDSKTLYEIIEHIAIVTSTDGTSIGKSLLDIATDAKGSTSTGLGTTEDALNQSSRISQLVTEDIPKVIQVYNESKEDIETELAKLDKANELTRQIDGKSNTSANTANNTSTNTADNTSTNTSQNNGSNKGGNNSRRGVEDYYSGGGGGGGSTGGGGGGGGSVPTPQYKKPADTSGTSSSTNRTPSTPASSNTSTNTPTPTNTPRTYTNVSFEKEPQQLVYGPPPSPTQTGNGQPQKPTVTNTTNTDNPTPGASIPTGGTTHFGGGYTGGSYEQPTYEEPANTSGTEIPIEVGTEAIEEASDSINSIIGTAKDYTKIPVSSGPIKSTSGSAAIPVAAGLSTAAAAGIGAKAFLDRNKEDDYEEDYDDDKRKWAGDASTDIDYNDGIEKQETLDDDEFNPNKLINELRNME